MADDLRRESVSVIGCEGLGCHLDSLAQPTFQRQPLLTWQGVCRRWDRAGLERRGQDSGERVEEVGCGAEIHRLLALGEPSEYRGKFFTGFLTVALASPKPGQGGSRA